VGPDNDRASPAAGAAEPAREGEPLSASAVGPLALMVLLPPLVAYLWMCARAGGALRMPDRAMLAEVPLPTPRAALALVGWVAVQAALQHLLPGRRVHGVPLEDGRRLDYVMNGWASFWLTWVVLAGLVVADLVRPARLYDEIGPLLATTNLATFAFCLYLYRHGRRYPDEGSREPGGPVRRYFMGASRNPRVGAFDWKLFFEARPGLIGWVAIDLACAAKQWELHGRLSGPMVLVCAMQAWYVADYFFHEEAILSTWDVRHENFGWMLCWGCIVWVPFTYSLQAQYLVHHPAEIGPAALAAVAALHVAGYVVFRGANLQKHRFRTDPTALIWGKPPAYMMTARGTALLASGYWGLARHMNYLGDLMMGLAWCLAAGIAHLLPYFYILYFTALLVGRERRDHAHCARKYGADWDAYCKRVRWRILPGVY
jgi:protein-S-isoprenylcysteine O-methyltransferase Ste14